jgi:hypothetical protein
LEALELYGYFGVDYDGFGHENSRQYDDLYRYHLSQSTPHWLKFEGEKGGVDV